MPEQSQIPRILWAQQREHVLLTISVPDIEKVDVKFDDDSVSFQGQSNSSNAKDINTYSVKIDLYEKIDPTTSKYENIGQKFWRLLLKKKDESAKFWPRLTKEKARLHWLQTDFDHWKDEDESDDEKGGSAGNFQDMFSGGMGGMPGLGGMGGMPGFGGMGGMPNMEDDDDDDDENDDDQAASSTDNNIVTATPNSNGETTTGEQEQSA